MNASWPFVTITPGLWGGGDGRPTGLDFRESLGSERDHKVPLGYFRLSLKSRQGLLPHSSDEVLSDPLPTLKPLNLFLLPPPPQDLSSPPRTQRQESP